MDFLNDFKSMGWILKLKWDVFAVNGVGFFILIDMIVWHCNKGVYRLIVDGIT